MENFVFEFIERHDYGETVKVYENKPGSKPDKISTLKNFHQFIVKVKRSDRKRKFNKLSFEVSGLNARISILGRSNRV